MPLWAYNIPPILLALIMVAIVEAISLTGLFLVRRFVLPRLRSHDGINDAVSGAVQAIGVFYGITVGLIAVGVWDTNTNASDLVSNEAAAIGALYRDVGGYPAPLKETLRSGLHTYTRGVIERDWPAQRAGRIEDSGIQILDDFQSALFAFEPSTPGQVSLHTETVRVYNVLSQCRRMRVNAVLGGLSRVMWAVIWIGAAFSISVAYLFHIEDPKIHAMLVALMAGFLAIVLFMVVINDKPFYGYVSTSPEPYQRMSDRMNALSK